jgi:hypothetical protein
MPRTVRCGRRVARATGYPVIASHLTIPHHLIRREDIAYDRAPLARLAQQARWAVAKHGIDPYLVLVNASSPSRYDD